jgi:hypothetical protein
MKRRDYLINIGIMALSLTMGLALCEMGARLFLNPADYLSPTMINDDVLGMKVEAGSGGFDQWGFRNRTIPATADIVAVGDSHTYGNNATMSDSWPYVAADLTGLKVYNLGLGGYGPNQYYELFKTRALQLRPRWIFCGLYMGDDFQNAFSITYGLDYWANLRQERWAGVDHDIWESQADGNWQRTIRLWLSRNSVVYRLVFHGPILGGLKGAVQIRQAARTPDSSVVTLSVPQEGIQEAFRPIFIRQRLDLRNPAIREGLRITLSLLKKMDDEAKKNGIRFGVVMIPTKETVFADFLLRDSRIPLKKDIQDLIGAEGLAREQVVTFLDQTGISYVDALPALRRNVGKQLYTKSDSDMHPAKNGYRVIGEAVAGFVNVKSTKH